MSADRRKAQGRRESASSGGRRDRNDRRDVERRGVVEKKRAVKQVRQVKKKSVTSFKGLFKLVAILFMASLAFFSLIFIIFFVNIDYFMSKATERLLIDIERVVIDPTRLTDKSSRVNINLRVNNRLPVDLIMHSITFTTRLSGYTIAKDAAFSPKVFVRGNSATTVPVSCQVDSIMMRRGLQKVIESNYEVSKKPAIAVLSSRPKSVEDDIKNMTVIEGIAEFRLSAGGIEIPFRRHFYLGKR